MIPKVVGRSIYSYGLSMVAFWTIAGVGAWAGLQKLLGGPLPPMLTAISGAAAILMLIPVIAIGINHYFTVRGHHELLQYSPTLRFTFFGSIGFSLTCLVGAILAFKSSTTSFTIAEDGFNMVALYFFFSMMMFGAVYFILPRVVGCEWLSRRMIQLHFWPSAYGSIGLGVWLVLGGLWQGVSLDTWNSNTVTAAGTSGAFLIGKSFIWICFIGFSNLVFIFHFLMMLFRLGRRTHEPLSSVIPSRRKLTNNSSREVPEYEQVSCLHRVSRFHFRLAVVFPAHSAHAADECLEPDSGV